MTLHSGIDNEPNLQRYASIRFATKEDMNILGRFGADLMQLHHDWDSSRFISPGPYTPSMYANHLCSQLGKSDVMVLVAEVEGTAVGYAYAGVEGHDYMALRGPAGVIHDVFVDAGQRRKGVGRMLLAAAVRTLGAMGATQVVLSTAHRNGAAQRLFASQGFEPTMIEMTKQLTR
ncbi:GNAT family N-acetyltransferase [Rhizobium sp. NPDC090275]|uniref:GNAT family N-acetyltransferase n=1 Tax=Rhizobium sp. NPDC090275 TaxID=3364498 RepID=UPI00383A0EA7